MVGRGNAERKNMKEKRKLVRSRNFVEPIKKGGSKPWWDSWVSYGMDQTWSDYAQQAIDAAEAATFEARKSADLARKHVEKATKEVE